MTQGLLAREACVFCNRSDLEILIPPATLPDRVPVLKCRKCGLVFLESRKKKDEPDLEETAYWDGAAQKKIYLETRIRKLFAKEFEKRLRKINQFVPLKGKLLDVGCGVGHFLESARKQGWEVQGLDIAHAAQALARETYGFDVQVGTLEDASFALKEFDVITLWDVIEHVRRPVENLIAANRMLRMNGVLVLKTPNEASFFKQFVLAMYRRFGRNAAFLLKYVYYVPHYFSYSEKTLNLLLNRCGFEAIHCERDGTPSEFAAEKIHVHYRKDPKRFWVVSLLPFASFIAKVLRHENKLVVYARKVREAGENE